MDVHHRLLVSSLIFGAIGNLNFDKKAFAREATQAYPSSQAEFLRDITGLGDASFLLASESKDVIYGKKDTLFDLKQCLEWFVSEEAEKLAPTVKNFPVKAIGDLEGDFVAIRKKIGEIGADHKCQLLNPKTEEERTIYRQAIQSLPDSTLKKLVTQSVSWPTTVGDKMYLSFYFFLFEKDPRILDLQTFGFESIMRDIPYKNDLVTWDGLKSKFVYKDQDLEYRIALVNYWLRFQSQIFFEEFQKLPNDIKDRWMRNLNSSDPITHVEPLDLVQGSIVRSYGLTPIGRITFTKAVHRYLFKAFNLTPEADPRGASLDDLLIAGEVVTRDPLHASLICAGPARLLNWPDEAGGISYGSLPLTVFSVNKAEIRKANQNTLPLGIDCNGKNYFLKSTPVAADPLAIPEAIDIEKLVKDHGAFNVLVTYSLTEETTDTLIAATIAYMNTHGYALGKIENQKSTEATFRKHFVKTDMLISAAHSVDITRFPLGTKKSRVLHFWKYVDGKNPFQKIPVHLVAIFPEKQGETEGLNPPLNLTQLAELFSKRRMIRPASLFSLTLSCHSGGAAIYWTNAYRRSLDIDIAEGRLDSVANARDLVQAIAPKGGFPTELPSDLLLDMVPALKSVDMIAKGHNPRQIFERLSQPFKGDWFINAVIEIQKWFKIEVEEVELNLNPVFNLDIPDLLNSSGYILEVAE